MKIPLSFLLNRSEELRYFNLKHLGQLGYHLETRILITPLHVRYVVSGYAAALGTIPALATKSDVVLLDKLCHASLIDGAKLSGAILRVFPHNHLGKLESHLEWARRERPEARVLIVTESVFSMDGDRAPLREVVALKKASAGFCCSTKRMPLGWSGRMGAVSPPRKTRMKISMSIWERLAKRSA